MLDIGASNLDFVRSLYADWERGNYSRADWAHREIEFVRADGPAPGSWTGLAEMASAWRDVLGAWDEHRSEAEDYRELDDGRVLVLSRNSARGKTSEVDTATDVAIVLTVRDDKVTRLVLYWDRDRAFADLGLAPKGD